MPKEKNVQKTNGKVVLFSLNPKKYREQTISITKKIPKSKQIIYVTLNCGCVRLSSQFKKAGISTKNILFIGCGEAHDAKEEHPSCVHIPNPHCLTDLSLALVKAAVNSNGQKVVVIDSISTLFSYHDSNKVVVFMNSLINKMRTMNVTTFLFVLNSDMEEIFLKRIMSFVDEIKKLP